MTWGMVALAVVLALDIFAGAISLGLQGLPRRQWARTVALIATVAFLMLVAGVLLGRSLGDRLGRHATYFAGVLLLLVGLRAVFEAVQEHEVEDLGPISSFSLPALFGISLVICMDKFAAGLSLAGSDQSLMGFMAWLLVQTLIVTFAGFWLGKQAGTRVESAAELIAGAIFVILGLVIISQTWNGSTLIVRRGNGQEAIVPAADYAC
jgi:putative Mn2+ efflux pump MntP